MIFISYLDISYSRSSVYLDDAITRSFTKIFLKINLPLYSAFKELLNSRHLLCDLNTVIVVMNPCHAFVPIIRLMTKQPIILDAGWPLSDSQKIELNVMSRIFNVMKNYLLDFIAFQTATCVLLESNAQINSTSKKFIVQTKKLVRIFTGFNENQYNSAKVTSNNHRLTLTKLEVNPLSNYIFFRGKYTKESGLEMIASLSRNKLSNFNFVILTNKTPKDVVFGKNVKIITNYLNELEISALYFGSIICIGQLSDNKRLLKTIPHKAFEAGFFGKPYVTIDTKSMRELYPNDNQVAYIQDFSEIESAKIIGELGNNEKLRKFYSVNISRQYDCLAKQEILQDELNDVSIQILPIKE